jgi:hypothetical protein
MVQKFSPFSPFRIGSTKLNKGMLPRHVNYKHYWPWFYLSAICLFFGCLTYVLFRQNHFAYYLNISPVDLGIHQLAFFNAVPSITHTLFFIFLLKAVNPQFLLRKICYFVLCFEVFFEYLQSQFFKDWYSCKILESLGFLDRYICYSTFDPLDLTSILITNIFIISWSFQYE